MLGTKIAALRRQAGLSQAELARRIGVSPSAMGMYEQGRREPSVDLLRALAAELEVTVDALLKTEELLPLPPKTGALLAALEEKGELRGITREELAVLCVALLIS